MGRRVAEAIGKAISVVRREGIGDEEQKQKRLRRALFEVVVSPAAMEAYREELCRRAQADAGLQPGQEKAGEEDDSLIDGVVQESLEVLTPDQLYELAIDAEMLLVLRAAIIYVEEEEGIPLSPDWKPELAEYLEQRVTEMFGTPRPPWADRALKNLWEALGVS